LQFKVEGKECTAKDKTPDKKAAEAKALGKTFGL
jgi:hypothetical protein